MYFLNWGLDAELERQLLVGNFRAETVETRREIERPLVRFLHRRLVVIEVFQAVVRVTSARRETLQFLFPIVPL